MWRDYMPNSRRLRRQTIPDSTRRAKLIAKLTKISFVIIILGILGILISIPLISRDLPSPDGVVRHSGFSTKIVDRNGQVLYDVFANQNSTPIDFKDMPLYLREGVISIEDKNFYKNNGFDVVGIIRGAFSTLFRRQIASGSTITQQLVKNVLLNSDQTLIRKFKEFILTAEVNSRFTKDQVLQMYLNEIPYGGTAVGVEAAS